MKCPRCSNDTVIESQEDSFSRVMRCWSCGWWRWLKGLNKHPEEDAGYVNA